MDIRSYWFGSAITLSGSVTGIYMATHDVDWDRIREIITPNWPVGFDRWESFVTLLVIGLFKLDRGTIMFRRATNIDRMGWSIIVFDWAMGALFLLSLFWSLYPGTRLAPWLPRTTILLLMVVTVWQWLEVRRASPVRVDLVAAGTNGGPIPWTPDMPDRRTGPPDRRGWAGEIADSWERTD